MPSHAARQPVAEHRLRPVGIQPADSVLAGQNRLVELLHQARKAASGVVAMDDAVAGGRVQRFLRLDDGLIRRINVVVDGVERTGDVGFHGRLGRPVALGVAAHLSGALRGILAFPFRHTAGNYSTWEQPARTG